MGGGAEIGSAGTACRAPTNKIEVVVSLSSDECSEWDANRATLIY